MRISRRVAVTVGAALVAVSFPLLAAPAHATTNPPWEPDPNATPGTLTFYNAAGDAVTGGSNLSHLFDYVKASSDDTLTGTKATLEFAQPTPSVVTANWPVGQASNSTAFPNASAPGSLGTATAPVVTLTATDANLTNFIATQTPVVGADYVNAYQLRVVTSGPGGVGTSPAGTYWDADITVNTVAGTWVETYPDTGAAATTTTTTLQASPASSSSQGDSVTLTATVAASDLSHPAGSVEFFQDGSSLGTDTASTSDGSASIDTTDLLASAPSGTQLTATFTPTNTSTYSPSTSDSLSYTVNPTAPTPKIKGSVAVGGSAKCSVNPLNNGVTAKYAWDIGSKQVATGAKYSPKPADYKKSLTCTITVKDGAGPSDSATSKAVKVGAGKPLKAKQAPALSGPGKAGKTEKVSTGTWSPKATSYSYQWFDGKKAIKGATKSKLKLPKSSKGDKVSCEVTASAKGYKDGTATTKAITVK